MIEECKQLKSEENMQNADGPLVGPVDRARLVGISG